MPKPMGSCFYCGGRVEADPVDDSPVGCPGCAGGMEAGGAGADVCTCCGGMWFNSGELEKLLAQRGEERSPIPEGANTRSDGVVTFRTERPPAEYRKCPRCRTTMSRRNFGHMSGVIIDLCPRHGIYLDAGELDRIRAFVESGGQEVSARLRQSEAERDRERAERLDKSIERMQDRLRASSRTQHRSGWAVALDVLDVADVLDFLD